MSKLFKSLFSGGKSAGKDAQSETCETKKCLRCLRRVAAHYDKCPHCRASDFQYGN